MNMRVHVSLEVANLQASIPFYAQLFGRAPTKVKEDYANFRMEDPNLHLALVHRPDRAPEPAFTSRHFGIELFSDEALLTWREAVKAAGLEHRIEERITCCYAVADKFWVQDPDGHEWEFWVRHEEADAMHDDAAVACCAPTEEASSPTEEASAPTPSALSAAEPAKASCCAPEQKQRAEERATLATGPCCAPTQVTMGTKPVSR